MSPGSSGEIACPVHDPKQLESFLKKAVPGYCHTVLQEIGHLRQTEKSKRKYKINILGRHDDAAESYEIDNRYRTVTCNRRFLIDRKVLRKHLLMKKKQIVPQEHQTEETGA